ncbi:3-methyladenine DNA glycosylase [Aestuariimicrobium ganziense]|uniref:3-methyladenine DNA glycosylase n=1 Tax=Aestuariimicrobium ganziense TaxID=2773677 RepID=UPI002E2B0BC9|nr:3-methyladenine DNA glycosylase [Aestuariimicrobium ganziense]
MPDLQRLTRAEWTARAEAHRERAGRRLAEVVERRRRGARHPIEDFLFDYYRLRPGDLLDWQPGAHVVLEDAPEFVGRRWYLADGDLVRLDVDALVAARGSTIDFVQRLLTSIEGRPAQHGCFGMHEWAMVHGLDPDQVRHTGLPLRFEPDEIRAIVDRVGLRCSHFDAFRFFTDSARPLNATQLTRADQVERDQAGCLHVGMDLYKWAGKLFALTSSEFLFDCFELAADIRLLDMRASAYDVSSLGHSPVPVETPAGRADYVAQQRGFTERAQPLRRRLVELTAQLRYATPHP